MSATGSGGRRWLYSLALLLAVVLGQWSALRSPLLPLADVPHALGNPAIRHAENLKFLASPLYADVFWEGSYHPVYTLITFANYSLFGGNPLGFRLLKVLVVWACALLIVRLGRKELGAWTDLAGLLYALQSAHVDISMLAMKDHLVALFCLLGLEWHRRSGRRGYPARDLPLLAALNALALLSKETGVVFPLLLLAMDVAQGAIPKDSSRKRWMAPYLACAATTALYAALRIWVVRAGGDIRWGFYGAARSTEALRQLGGYLRDIASLQPPVLAASTLPLCAILVASFARASKGARLFAGGCLAWMFLGILPVSGLLPILPLSEYLAGSLRPSRYLVLPGLGYAWLLALSLRESLGRKKWRLAALPLLFCFGFLSRAFPPAPRPAYEANGCRRVGERVEGGSQCFTSLAQVLVSLPRMRTAAPSEYAAYRAGLDRLLGPRAPAVERYFDGALEDPVRASYLVSRLGAPDQDFETLWTGIRVDNSLLEGRELLRRGEPRKALGILSGIERAEPDNPSFHFEKAEALWQSGLWPQALREYNAYKRYTDETYVAAHRRQRNAPSPDPEFETVLETAINYSRYVAAPAAADEPRRALRACLQQVTGASHADAEEYLSAGGAGLRGGAASREIPFDRLPPRRDWLRLSRRILAGRASERPPAPECASRVPARSAIQAARAAIEKGRPALARAALEEAARRLPDRDAWHGIALAYQALNDYPRAIPLLRWLVMTDPENASLYNDLGVCEYLSGAVEPAIRDTRKSIELAPESAGAYLTLGGILIKENRAAEAAALYARALLRLKRDDPLRAIVESDREFLMKGRP